jgi:16S rRNA C1402 N4-methylase RsmH
VKRFMHEEARKACLKLVYKKVITPSRAEVHFNPRSRSAKLRAAECITTPREVSCG